MTATNGSPSKILLNTITTIPPSELSRIAQIKSSPATIAALLNEAENTFSDTPKHWNAKRRYPFWKVCRNCSVIFPCHTKEQASRNQYCGKACAPKNPGKVKLLSERKGRTVTCSTCGKETWKPDAWLRKIKATFCSHKCNGAARGKEWANHAYKGRAAWTAASESAFRERMKGEKNPAWKGGVTYFKRKGKYANQKIKYVRCPQEFASMARKDGYVMEHRLNVAKAIGRALTRMECVHHVNHDATDNRPENLMLFATNSDHKRFEHHGTPDPIWRG
jgi:hypothetical protein